MKFSNIKLGKNIEIDPSTSFNNVIIEDNVKVAKRCSIFGGDNDLGRPLRTMDFMTNKLWEFYQNLGYDYIDLVISTESGKLNEGLLRFKEMHESISSLRYSFLWSPNKNNL